MIGTRDEWLAACSGRTTRRPRQLLDRTPKGRGSREDLGDWPRRHDEYEEVIHAG